MSSSKRASETRVVDAVLQEPVPRAVTLVARYAGAGVRSTQDVRDYLARRGVASPLAERVIAACQAQGLLDDAACARLWAEQWARRGYAWAAIQVKLAVKGLDRQAIHAAARHLGGARGDAARARALLAHRSGRTERRGGGAANAPGERARLARRLASRGFSPELIERVLDPPSGDSPSNAEC